MMRGMPAPRRMFAGVAADLLVVGPLGAVSADRPVGAIFSRGQELRQKNLPDWRLDRNPFPPPVCVGTKGHGILRTAGATLQ